MCSVFSVKYCWIDVVVDMSLVFGVNYSLMNIGCSYELCICCKLLLGGYINC